MYHCFTGELICKGVNATPMYYAARQGNVDGIKALKEEGAYVSVQDNVGRTATHYAASNRQMDAINALKEAGANH
jgi:ankyrin repeat protein